MKTNLILIFIILKGFENAENKCLELGKTWSSDGEISVLGPISTVFECIQKCNEQTECFGYTWYEENNQFGIPSICILFNALNDEYNCGDCISGQRIGNTDDCLCDSTEGACVLTDDDFLGGQTGHSKFECFVQCLFMDGCNFYTFYSDKHVAIHNQCLFFSTCDETNPSIGSYYGNIDCDPVSTTTMSTTIVTTQFETTTSTFTTEKTTEKMTTTPSKVCDHIDYK